jgi:hypothetical protein
MQIDSDSRRRAKFLGECHGRKPKVSNSEGRARKRERKKTRRFLLALSVRDGLNLENSAESDEMRTRATSDGQQGEATSTTSGREAADKETSPDLAG